MTEPAAHPGTHHNATPTPEAVPTDIDDRDWTALAACREMDTEFFYSGKPGSQQPQPRAVCARCPVILECFNWAMAVEEHVGDDTRYGVWGGQTPSGRAQIQRARSQALAAGEQPETYNREQLRVMARNGRGAKSLYTGAPVPRRDHNTPEVGSRWISMDKRNTNRCVVVVEVTDQYVFLQREQTPGDFPSSKPYRRSRIQASQFTYRYLPQPTEAAAP